jgi:hypothetical protein
MARFSAGRTRPSPRRARRTREHVAEHESVTLDDFAHLDVDRCPESRRIPHEGVELAALPARVDGRGEVVQEPRVEVAPDVPGIELGRVDTGEDRPDPGGDDLPGKCFGRPPPQGEQRRDAEPASVCSR